MTPENFNPRHWRLEIAIFAIFTACMVYFMINIFNDLQHKVEKENAITQVQNFKIGLSENWLNRNITHKSSNLIAFENTNPMLLIAELPKNYIGELAKTPQDKKSVWFYHTKKQQLIYVLSNGDLMKFRLVKAENKQKISRLPNGGLNLVEVSK